MTLDSWLSRASTPGSPSGCPAAKRQRQNGSNASAANSGLPGRGGSRVTFNPPPKFDHKYAKSLPRENWPPEYLFGRRNLLPWYSSRGFYDPAYPCSLACLPDSPHSIIGLETGDVHVVRCGSTELGLYDPTVGRATSILQTPGEYKSPVRDLAALDNGLIISTSGSGIHSMDLNHGAASTLVGTVLDVSHVSVYASSSQVIAYGTSSGSVGLVDLRERLPKVVKEWNDAHAVLGGPRAQRVRHGITALAFCSDTLLATGANSNECVKFWDVRATSRKQPIHTTAPRSSTRRNAGGEGGIIDLAGSITDPGRALWALNRSGELLKIDAESSHPQYRLHVPKMCVNSTYASIDLIPDTSAVKQSKTGHRAPEWPLIACGGKNSVTLVTEPSGTARNLDVDACQASSLPCCEAADVTKVKWHPYTNELITISEDNACRLWALRGSHKIPSQFLSTSDSSALSHQPKKTKVAMTPIAF